ncbi:MAG: DinB family protein [Dehalococcoidia bacterium]
MGDLKQLVADLEAARGDLLASFAGIDQATFDRAPAPADPTDRAWSVGDVLWHVGLVEDWIRRTVDQGVHDRDPAPYAHRDRPAIARTPEYLAEWLEQTRRPLLALLRRLPEDQLGRVFVLTSGERRMVRPMLEHIAAHDREHAAQIRAQIGALRQPGQRDQE